MKIVKFAGLIPHFHCITVKTRFFEKDETMKVRAITVLVATQVLGGLLLIIPSTGLAVSPTGIERAEGATLSKAVGHWSRARAYLNLAVREFDKGTEFVDPDAVIDAKELRSQILEKIQILERVIDPQPRVTEEGVRYNAAPELIGANKN